MVVFSPMPEPFGRIVTGPCHVPAKAFNESNDFCAPDWAQAAVAAIVLLAAGVIFNLHNQQPARLLADDVVSAHVRSLQADHLLDVVSTDQHTVRPWFEGKLDFAPAFKDLVANGFPLAGGRVEYFDHHPVAVLVYHHGKHVINVFVWPADRATVSKSETSQGFNLLSWTANGMQYSAVSDVNPQDLHELARLLQ